MDIERIILKILNNAKVSDRQVCVKNFDNFTFDWNFFFSFDDAYYLIFSLGQKET